MRCESTTGIICQQPTTHSHTQLNPTSTQSIQFECKSTNSPSDFLESVSSYNNNRTFFENARHERAWLNCCFDSLRTSKLFFAKTVSSSSCCSVSVLLLYCCMLSDEGCPLLLCVMVGCPNMLYKGGPALTCCIRGAQYSAAPVSLLKDTHTYTYNSREYRDSNSNNNGHPLNTAAVVVVDVSSRVRYV